jgi:predicted HNH restriction endonuclease
LDFGVRAAEELKPGMEIAIICGTNRYDCKLVAIIKDPRGEIGDIFGWARQFEAPWKNVCALKMLNRNRIAARELAAIKRKMISITNTFFRAPELDLKKPAVKKHNNYDVVLVKYERDSAARRQCIEHHGAVCKICGFDFYETYGELGRGFIHVHHKMHDSEKDKSRELNPIKDLVPVCPNCHAMLHPSKNDTLPVEKLKKIYIENLKK